MGERDLFRFKKRDEYKDTKDGSSRIMEDAISIRAHLFNDGVHPGLRFSARCFLFVFRNGNKIRVRNILKF